jgi:hypothetical protein
MNQAALENFRDFGDKSDIARRARAVFLAGPAISALPAKAA